MPPGARYRDRLVCRGDDDPTILGGHQHVTVTDALHHGVLHCADRGVDVLRAAAGRGQRDLVRSGHVQPERFGPLDQPSHIGVAAQQVVDEFRRWVSS